MAVDPTKPKPLVFIADSDDEAIRLMRVALGKLPTDVEVFANSETFLERLRMKKPSLCVIDLTFEKVGSGFEMIQAVRDISGLSLPLLVSSSASDTKSIAHAIEIGANDYIVKPVDVDIFQAKVMNYVRVEEVTGGGFAFFGVPSAIAAAAIAVEVDIIGVDELGVKLGSAHRLKKGAFIKISGDSVADITGRKDPLPVTIESTWVEPGSDRYSAYATFDPEDEELMRNIRRWLANRVDHPS